MAGYKVDGCEERKILLAALRLIRLDRRSVLVALQYDGWSKRKGVRIEAAVGGARAAGLGRAAVRSSSVGAESSLRRVANEE